MKRTYIKPFMESEEFVTNEYVAACFNVSCGRNLCNYETFTIKGNDEQSAIATYLHDINGGNDSFHPGDPEHKYATGIIGTSPEETDEYYHVPWGALITDTHHRLTISKDEGGNFS